MIRHKSGGDLVRNGPLVMTLLVRNEADIVRQNIEFHLSRGVDHIIATDNGSSDGTTEILEEFRKCGGLTLFHEPSGKFLQKEWVNRMIAFGIEKFGFAWLLNNDADEFWRPPNKPDGSVGNLKELLATATVPMITCRRVNLLASANELDGTDWQDKLVWRSRVASAPISKGLLGVLPKLHPYFFYRLPEKVIVHSAGLIEVEKGAHTARYSEPVKSEDLGIEILHCPVRSSDEFRDSVLQISDSLEFNQNLKPGQSSKYVKWRKVFDKTGSTERLLKKAVPGASRLMVYRLTGLVTKDMRLRDDLALLETHPNKSPTRSSIEGA